MRFFAIVPAAGHSRRMGRPKLLLPLRMDFEPSGKASGRGPAGTSTPSERPVINYVLAAWRGAGVDAAVAIVRRDDPALAQVCQTSGALVVSPPNAPPDMKTSVWHGLEFIRQQFAPADEDCWMLAPGDMPWLRSATIRAVMEVCRANPGRAVAPVCQGRRGHPAAFPWPMAAEVARLGPDEGVKALLEQEEPLEARLPATESLACLTDLDTPEQYERLRKTLWGPLTDEPDNA